MSSNILYACRIYEPCILKKTAINLQTKSLFSQVSKSEIKDGVTFAVINISVYPSEALGIS